MRVQKILGLLVIPAMLVAGSLFVSTGAKAADDPSESEKQVNQLLEEIETEATQLKFDADHMNAFARSKLSWQSHATQIEVVKGHVNQAGKLLAQLHESREGAAGWQQKAIDEITPLLQELADNISAAIEHLNANRGRIHDPAYMEYAAANYRTALELSKLIGDYVEYGKAHETLGSLGDKLNVAQD